MFLGIDGGQSSTTALIGDETGRVTGYGRGGPCNHVKGPGGREKFVSAISGCLASAGGEGLRFRSVCGGFSGGPADKEQLLEEMFPGAQVFSTNDARIALTGATAGEPGIITIGGTGSIAFGRGRGGRTARAGGWGYVFGDEGGGFDLARQALRAALREEEGWGPRTSLTQALLDETGAANVNDLLHRFYTSDWPRPRIAALSRLVDREAANGDRVAGDLIHAAAQQLAGYTSAVRGMLFEPGESARVAWIGGVFQSDLLRERYRLIVELEDGNICAPPEYPPAAGALLEAYRLAGLNVALTGVPELSK
ncbi:MAG: BadF/BadG/BcrA/BcrD ATPase family protein [Bryobacteraceae bacterium]|nr:BadF/BadG/BcrA/BcrD ATPase family protein [Bryobacteraceae bacterium]